MKARKHSTKASFMITITCVARKTQLQKQWTAVLTLATPGAMIVLTEIELNSMVSARSIMFEATNLTKSKFPKIHWYLIAFAT